MSFRPLGSARLTGKFEIAPRRYRYDLPPYRQIKISGSVSWPGKPPSGGLLFEEINGSEAEPLSGQIRHMCRISETRFVFGRRKASDLSPGDGRRLHRCGKSANLSVGVATRTRIGGDPLAREARRTLVVAPWRARAPGHIGRGRRAMSRGETLKSSPTCLRAGCYAPAAGPDGRRGCSKPNPKSQP
jgi:hypothetical protein